MDDKQRATLIVLATAAGIVAAVLYLWSRKDIEKKDIKSDKGAKAEKNITKEDVKKLDIKEKPPVKEAVELFNKTYKIEPTTAVFAPGRANIIGEHTDYNDGFVLPMALSKSTVIVAAPVPNSTTISLISADFPTGIVEFDFKQEIKNVKGDWSNYVKGVVQQFKKRNFPLVGFKAAIFSTVPLGGGVSSSAALEVATVTLLSELSKVSISKIDRALIGQSSSHEFIGVPCGIMDQLISSVGEEGHAILIDCRTPKKLVKVPLDDPNVVILVANTNVKHELVGSPYATRRSECEQAVKAIQKANPKSTITHLRDCSMKQLEDVKSTISPSAFKRARHAINEDIRTLGTVEALKNHDYKTVGKNMFDCHASLRDDFEVSCEELDVIVEIARGEKGVYGARMMGGGFGGCVVTLVHKDSVDSLINKINTDYPLKCNGLKATCFISVPGPGADVISLKL